MTVPIIDIFFTTLLLVTISFSFSYLFVRTNRRFVNLISISVQVLMLAILVFNILEKLNLFTAFDILEEYLEVMIPPLILLNVFAGVAQGEKRELMRKEETLSRMVTERDNLIREIHHRVKNTIQIIVSLVSIEFDDVEEPSIVSRLSDMSQRIQVLSDIYETMLSSEEIVSVSSEILFTKIVHTAYIQSGNADALSSLRMDISDILIPVDTAHHLGLWLYEVVRDELIATSCHTGISILFAAGSSYDLSLVHPGITEQRGPASPTADLIVKAMAEQLSARMEIDTDAGTFTISVPKKP